MARLTLLLLLAALVVPSAASALSAPDREQPTVIPINARGTDVAADFRARGGEAAARDARARAADRYYSPYGEPTPIVASAPASQPVASGHDGPSWFGALGIGVGVMLLAGGLGIYVGRSLRPHQMGA